MSTEKVNEQVAEEDFERFCENQRIDLDESDFDPEEAKDFALAKKRIVKAIQQGRLVVNESHEAVYTANDKEFVFKQPKGSSLLAMDRAKKGQDMKAIFDLMGDICECPPAIFSKMELADTKVCMSIATLFLGS